MEFTKEVTSSFNIGSYLLGNFVKEDLYEISQSFFNYSLMFLPVLFITSIILEMLAGDDKSLVNLIRRTIYCIIFANTGIQIFEGTIAITFAITDAIIIKWASQYQYLKFFTVDEQVWWKTAADTFGDVIFNLHLSSIWLVTYLAITLIGKVYAVIYKFLLIAIPFLSILSVFTLTKRAIYAVGITFMSMAIFPIICSIVMITLGSSEAPADNIIPSIPRMANLAINALIVFWVPAITSGIIAGKGMHSVVEQFSSSTAMMGITMGKSFFLSKIASPLTMPVRRKFFAAMGKNGFTRQFLQNPNKYRLPQNRISDSGGSLNKTEGSSRNSSQMTRDNSMHRNDNSTLKQSNPQAMTRTSEFKQSSPKGSIPVSQNNNLSTHTRSASNSLSAPSSPLSPVEKARFSTHKRIHQLRQESPQYRMVNSNQSKFIRPSINRDNGISKQF